MEKVKNRYVQKPPNFIVNGVELIYTEREPRWALLTNKYYSYGKVR